MDIKIIENRLVQYNIKSKLDEINALKEIIQEIVLATLSRTHFFKQAAFQGGTCLRILYGLQRFSEDLDFILLQENTPFEWQPLLNAIQLEFEAYGLKLEVKDRSKAENDVKKAFLKEDSFGKILTMYPRNKADQKIQIKLEIDTRPPKGSTFETKYLDFPFPFSLTLQDRKSLFAGKCHALLCRKYVKGRDWYDFTWYVSQKTPINYEFLTSALHQTGPWQDQNIIVTPAWLVDELKQKIKSIDWNAAKQDVAKFLKPPILETLELWNEHFFLNFLGKLEGYSIEKVL